MYLNKLIESWLILISNEIPNKIYKIHHFQIWLALQQAQKEKLDQATYNQLLDLRPQMDYETMVRPFYFILLKSKYSHQVTCTTCFCTCRC